MLEDELMDAQASTSYGDVQGSHEDGVDVFRGIPYARPPVGDLRFRAPQPPDGWEGVRDATGFGACSYQAASASGVRAELLPLDYPREDEDCLTLNIWTPAADGRRRPVMVWIHGGSFVNGAGSLATYDGAALAKQGDVVVVTLNYRLGAFGFLHLDSQCGPEFDASGNQGLLDQIAALEWVRAEIGAFGGDPTNITVFGQSAGAISIAAMLSMPATTGLFEKAILQSGSANLVRGVEAAAATGQLLLDDLGLMPAQAGRLREMSAADIVASQNRATPPGAIPVYGPVTDEEMIPGDPFGAIAEGSASSVSLLIGTTEDETRLYLAADPAIEQLDDAGLRAELARTVGGEDAEERAEAAIACYRTARAERGEDTSARSLLYAMSTDVMFRCPAMRLAEIQAKHVPVYTYVFDYPSPALDGRLGTPHGAEIPFVFGTYAHPQVRSFSGDGPEAEEVSAAVQEAWVRFARFGSPSTPRLPEWPAYEPVQRWTMRLGREAGAEQHPRETERSFWAHPVSV